MFNVVKSFLADGVPVDAIGFQCHFGLNQIPTDLQANLQRFADLGLDVAITELDINLGAAFPGNATSLAQQAQNYWQVINACVQTNRCVSTVSFKLLGIVLQDLRMPILDCVGRVRRPLMDSHGKSPSLG